MKLLSCTIVITFLAASSALDALPWWQTATIYQVYPLSFKDSDGNGFGDLKGITQMADHFKDIGVDAIWLSPIFKSPFIDFGYDIANYTDIDPLFGTMEDFYELRDKLKAIGVKLLLDFVPNHTSDEHLWFQISKNTSDPRHSDFRDFYIWKDAKGWNNDSTPIPPNNWVSIIGGSAWEWWPERNQFYMHNFRIKQPELNYTNPKVLETMTGILQFWMDQGVDGFRMDAVKWLIEDEDFPDDPIVPGTAGDDYYTVIHKYDQNQPATYDLLKYWADVVRNRSLEDGIDRPILLEVWNTINLTMEYYGTGNQRLEYPFNFFFFYTNQLTQFPSVYRYIIETWMNAMPRGSVSNWVIGSHDQSRSSTRFGSEMVDSMNLLSGVLPGVKIVYYGEEIGMQDTMMRSDQSVDKSHFASDRFRSPMQWDDTASAGFSSNSTTWLPLNPNYWWLNVAAQKTAEKSHMKVFQAMTQARKDPVLQRGDLNVLAPDNSTLIIIRYYNDVYFALIMNMGSSFVTYTSQNLFAPNMIDLDMTVIAGSVHSGYKEGSQMRQGSISLTLRPKAAVLLRLSEGSSSGTSSGSSAHTFPLLCVIFILPALLYK